MLSSPGYSLFSPERHPVGNTEISIECIFSSYSSTVSECLCGKYAARTSWMCRAQSVISRSPVLSWNASSSTVSDDCVESTGDRIWRIQLQLAIGGLLKLRSNCNKTHLYPPNTHQHTPVPKLWSNTQLPNLRKLYLVFNSASLRRWAGQNVVFQTDIVGER